jgi:hypothetical protein
MKQEHKDLLLKDLCNRIMYGVKCTVYENTSVHTLSGVLPNKVHSELYFEELDWKEYDGFADIQYCKPYLFPLSSMTEEQKQYISDRWGINEDFDFEIDPNWGEYIVDSSDAADFVDWLNENHFDYRWLILKGIALDATNKNIY